MLMVSSMSAQIVLPPEKTVDLETAISQSACLRVEGYVHEEKYGSIRVEEETYA